MLSTYDDTTQGLAWACSTPNMSWTLARCVACRLRKSTRPAKDCLGVAPCVGAAPAIGWIRSRKASSNALDPDQSAFTHSTPRDIPAWSRSPRFLRPRSVDVKAFFDTLAFTEGRLRKGTQVREHQRRFNVVCTSCDIHVH